MIKKIFISSEKVFKRCPEVVKKLLSSCQKVNKKLVNTLKQSEEEDDHN
jgi:hypothetical protein